MVGVGGGGGNAVVRMTQQSIPGVEFWCLNTDAQVSEPFVVDPCRVASLRL